MAEEEELSGAEDAAIMEGNYTSCEDCRDPAKPRQAIDFLDARGPAIRILNACRARARWSDKKECPVSCGFAFPNKTWWQGWKKDEGCGPV